MGFCTFRPLSRLALIIELALAFGMPSRLHEALLHLFRRNPTLAAKLMGRALHVRLPTFKNARTDSADLTDIQPAEYRADLVIVLTDKRPVLGIIVEVQNSKDARKLYTWPVYLTALRARLKCPVHLLVVTFSNSVARWAAQPILLGGGTILPLVLSRSSVPAITSATEASEDPELAVLSAMAFGKSANTRKSARIARIAMRAARKLSAEHYRLYVDLILSLLDERAKQELKMVNSFNWEYQSDFAKKFMAEGRAEGAANVVLEQLAQRFGALSRETRQRVQAAHPRSISAIAKRLLTARTLTQALDGRGKRRRR